MLVLVVVNDKLENLICGDHLLRFLRTEICVHFSRGDSSVERERK